MDQLQTRLEALEQQIDTVNRRLRWWRGLASGLMVLAVLTWALPVVTADDAKHDKKKDLEQRVATLEELLKPFSRKDHEVFITGANLHIVNGLGRTDCGPQEEPIPNCPNGLGNLIVGYNEPREPFFGETIRTGSHNIVIGPRHNFSRFGGLVVSDLNTISGDFASVSGGRENTASGPFAAVSGGENNTASGDFSAVCGGSGNTASGIASAVSGGNSNTASGEAAAVSGGSLNTASGGFSAVSGGNSNTASGVASAVSGGGFNPETGEGAGNTASGDASSVSGGSGNIAAGALSSVSGGRDRTAEGAFDWVAGSLFEDE